MLFFSQWNLLVTKFGAAIAKFWFIFWKKWMAKLVAKVTVKLFIFIALGSLLGTIALYGYFFYLFFKNKQIEETCMESVDFYLNTHILDHFVFIERLFEILHRNPENVYHHLHKYINSSRDHQAYFSHFHQILSQEKSRAFFDERTINIIRSIEVPIIKEDVLLNKLMRNSADMMKENPEAFNEALADYQALQQRSQAPGNKIPRMEDMSIDRPKELGTEADINASVMTGTIVFVFIIVSGSIILLRLY